MPWKWQLDAYTQLLTHCRQKLKLREREIRETDRIVRGLLSIKLILYPTPELTHWLSQLQICTRRIRSQYIKLVDSARGRTASILLTIKFIKKTIKQSTWSKLQARIDYNGTHPDSIPMKTCKEMVYLF